MNKSVTAFPIASVEPIATLPEPITIDAQLRKLAQLMRAGHKPAAAIQAEAVAKEPGASAELREVLLLLAEVLYPSATARPNK